MRGHLLLNVQFTSLYFVSVLFSIQLANIYILDKQIRGDSDMFNNPLHASNYRHR